LETSPPKDDHVGLIVSLCLAGIVLVMFVIVQIQFDKVKRKEMAAARLFIQKSSSTNPDIFFAQLVGEWHKLQDVLAENDPIHIDADTLEVQRLDSSHFILTVPKGGFGDEGEFNQDLGIDGKRHSIDIVSAIVWMCGSQIINVQEIRVHLSSTDGITTASYDVKITPNYSFERSWRDYEDLKLKDFVEENLVIVSDDASGKKWIKVPKH
jgi:hypothetical protein